MSEEERLTVGQILRKERETKNLSLDSVAGVTRISLENLKALEKDDFRAISAPIFARGFLRTYASHLGLDPKEILARYESQIDLVKLSPKIKESAPERSKRSSSKYLVFVFLIVIGVAAGFYLFQQAPAPPTASLPAAPVPAPPTADVQPPPSPTPASPEKVSVTPPAPVEKPPAAAPEPKEEEKAKERRHVLRAVAREKTWMRVKPDDQPVSDVLLQPGQTASWFARRRFDVIIGNAGGADLSLNGAPLGPLGKSGEVVNLTLPKEGKAPGPASQTETGIPEKKY